eukprot:PhM_4_TR9291/c0_g1_i1/m.84792/K00275/pdxH, PNPO; pyridoxamine 5'-phosphate oxidase
MLRSARSVPFTLFSEWFEAAKTNDIDKLHTNAVALATSTSDGFPSVRMVLMQHYDERGFCFYTNLGSRKATELDANPKASVVFFWKGMQRQVRVEGSVERVTEAEADAYHNKRPRGSQIAAWASAQSEVLPDCETFQSRVIEMEKKFEGMESVPRPPHWGGYRLCPTKFEFWQEGEFRMHSRNVFEKIVKGQEESPENEKYWENKMLYP